MIPRWQLQEAKNRFSEVVEKALSQGPQLVTRRGVETVMVISMEDYEKLTRPKTGIVDFFKNSPLKDVELTLERDKGLDREIEL